MKKYVVRLNVQERELNHGIRNRKTCKLANDMLEERPVTVDWIFD